MLQSFSCCSHPVPLQDLQSGNANFMQGQFKGFSYDPKSMGWGIAKWKIPNCSVTLSKRDCQCSHLPPSPAQTPEWNIPTLGNKHTVEKEPILTWDLSAEKFFLNIPDICFSAVPFSTNNFWTHPVWSSRDRLHSCTRETYSLQSFAGTKVTELHIACWISQNICSWNEWNAALHSWKACWHFGVENGNKSLDSVTQCKISLAFQDREFIFSAHSYYFILRFRK